MRQPNPLNLAQRIVLVVAAAFLLQVTSHWVLYSAAEGGWFGYAPQSAITFPEFSDVRRFSSGTTTVITGAFIAAWAGFSVWLLPDGNRNAGSSA